MKTFLLLFLLTPGFVHAAFILQYGLNYSSEKDDSSNDDYEKTRTFHKIFLGASVNQRKTLYLGWNINSWSSELTRASDSEEYSLLEMGPRLTYFFNENYNFYLTAEWNPYARGDRKKGPESAEISGSSYSAGIGYRFRLSRLWGLGAGVHYHHFGLSTETINSTEKKLSDTVGNVMPMLELTLITK